MKKYHKKSLEENIFDSIINLISFPFKKKKSLSEKILSGEEIKTRWQKIEELMGLGGESRFKQAIIEADKLLDRILQSGGIKGENMGQRLKNAKEKFNPSIYQGIWQAHKLRNDIVHQMDKEVLYHEAKDAIEKFKRGLEGFGAL